MTREVLASLDIDETQAVSALKTTVAQFRVLEGGASKAAQTLTHEFDRAAPAFTHHLLSMRAAAAGLLGGLSIAGAVGVFKSLVEEAARGSASFKALDASASVFHNELVGLIRDIPGFNAALGETGEILLYLGALVKTIGPGGLFGLIAGAPAIAFGPDFLEKYRAALEAVRGERDRLLNPPAAKVKSFALPTFGRPIGASGFEGANFEGISGALQRFSPVADSAAAATARLHDRLMGIQKLDIGGEFARAFQYSGTTIKAFADSFPSLLERLNEAGGAFDSLKTAAGEAFGALLAGENIDLRKFLRGVLTNIAAESSVKGIFSLAEGFGALATTWGVPNPKSIAAFTAAGHYFEAAALAGGAARLAGGSNKSGTGGGGSGSHAAAVAAPSGGQTVNVSVSIEGSAIGIGTSAEEFAREMAVAIQRAIRDGAAGGNI